MDMTSHGHAHPKAVHNMVLIGERQICLSHLPMFMAPHNAQVLLEATFSSHGKSVDDVYFADRAGNRGTRFYTVQPEPFALRELFQSGPAPQRTTFTATVFRGHLEKGGTPVDGLENIDVHVTRLIHAHSFEGSRQATLSYVLFGTPQELYMAHVISSAPDFDQLLAVSGAGSMPSAEELRRGVTVEVVDRPNLAVNRVQGKETVRARAHVTGAHQLLDVKITAHTELYFEEGELSGTAMTADMFDQTQAERKAGF
jgi:hypothetical protein